MAPVMAGHLESMSVQLMMKLAEVTAGHLELMSARLVMELAVMFQPRFRHT